MESESIKLNMGTSVTTDERPSAPVVLEEEYIGRPATTLQRALTLAAILIPFAGLVVSIAWFWQSGVGWTELCLFVGMYLASGFGITIGYHRLFAHRAFETFAPIRGLLAVLGTMAIQGPVLRWVAVHRRHHQYSDQEDDPHSPNTAGAGIRGFLKGMYHAHMGWMFSQDYQQLSKYVRDLRTDRLVCGVNRHWVIWALLGLVIPTVLGGVITGSWTGALLGFLWGGLVRTFFVHHVTWSINSVCHIWGRRPYDCRDHSKNNLIFGILGLGEGWHNNHHAFPNSARHGLSWWQIDFSYMIIKAMQYLGIAWQVRLVSPESMQMKRASSGN